jgi:pimeloyl-ACP methyl ester carboxylesterase/tetratricopeptide (TPR) repeat protein
MSILMAAVLTLAPLLPGRPDGHAWSQDTASTAGVRLHSVRLSTGVELQVAERGRADGQAVLFLHGFTDSWFSYSRVLDGLPSSIRAIVPTQRGHGDSERPACCYRVSDFAADAVALLDALGVERATVVGHSMGSFIAQRIAIERPERVNRLVLIGSGTKVATDSVVELHRTVQKLTDPIPPAFVRDFQEDMIARPVPPAFLDTVVRESEKLPARIWREALTGLLAPEVALQPDRIHAQTLIIWGEKDLVFARPDQDDLVRAIRGARLIAYPEIGHSPHWELPDRFIADLKEFLEARVVTSPAERHAGSGHAHAAHSRPGPMALMAGLGDWHHEITTTSPEAQRYFDQGLRLAYAFNHDEAVRSFERAVELDPGCAMCHWGLAYALGPNINLPMEARIEPRALAAIGAAVRLKERTTPLERALIEAMAARYGEPAGAARAERDAAYAAAMRVVAQRNPDDVDTQVLFADAMLNLRPWNQWMRDGRPQPGTEELVAALERALQREPQHAGGCHLYIHAVEASDTPERALACAERLPRLMPGAGHIVHMPAHVYLRVGRYEDAARANVAAVEADNRYLAAGEVRPGFYPLFYAPHNLHFLWATYLLSGQHAKAVNASRALADRVAIQDARANASLEAFLAASVLTQARFSDWDAVLAEPAPPNDLRYVRGMWHYARGLAFAARGDVRAATGELGSVRTIAADVKDDVIIILNPAPVLLKLAAEVLAGHIAARQGRGDDAIARFRRAVVLEDGLTYDEPPSWYHSVRNVLGEALLAAGRTAEAEATFREDLRHVRETGWSLAGLERALRAQGKTREAADVARRFKDAWQYADAPAHANE